MTFFLYYLHHANIKYLAYKHIYDQETRLFVANLRNTSICKKPRYIGFLEMFFLGQIFCMQMCLQNIYRCFAISFTPILQLIQTRRIFVPDQGKLEKTIQTLQCCLPTILKMSIKKDHLFTYYRFNAWMSIYINSQYNEACYLIVNVVVDVKVTFTNYEEYLKKY